MNWTEDVSNDLSVAVTAWNKANPGESIELDMQAHGRETDPRRVHAAMLFAHATITLNAGIPDGWTTPVAMLAIEFLGDEPPILPRWDVRRLYNILATPFPRAEVVPHPALREAIAVTGVSIELPFGAITGATIGPLLRSLVHGAAHVLVWLGGDPKHMEAAARTGGDHWNEESRDRMT